MFYDKETGSQKDRLLVLQSVGHELAHQFIGNLVSTVLWDGTWFYEGVSILLEYDLLKNVCRYIVYSCIIITEKFFVQLGDTGSRFIYRSRLDNDNSNCHESGRAFDNRTRYPAIRPVETADEAQGMFVRISYSKGGVLFID